MTRKRRSHCRILIYRSWAIHYFHIDHNAPCLPPNILHNHCLRFLLGRLKYPGEIENNGYAKFWGVNKMYYGLFENGELQKEVLLVVYCPLKPSCNQVFLSQSKANALE